MSDPRAASRFWILATVIACAGGIIFFYDLGRAGFSMSEGHRVAPAWEMLRNHDWFMPHMFEQAYLRKPPGMPWAIALFTSVLGYTEIAARAVSGVSMILAAIASAWFARRWFGNSAGICAGLAHVLLPWMWESGRAAEIEALNNLGTVLATWGAVDLLARTRRAGSGGVVALAAIGLFISALAKGPASLPVIISVPLAACLVARGIEPLKSARYWSSVGIAAAAIGSIALLIVQRSVQEQGSIVTQGVNEFLWTLHKAPQILALPLVFLASAMPLSLALFPALFSRELDIERTRLARILAAAAAAAVLIYACAGVSNPRYTLPAAAILSPLIGFAIEAWSVQSRAGARGQMARLVSMLVKPAAAVLFLAAIGYAMISERSRSLSSGRSAGIELGNAVEDGTRIIANDMIEARPEVLLYAVREAKHLGRHVEARWVPTLADAPLPAAAGGEKTYLLLRSDAGSNEVEKVKRALPELEALTFHARVGPANRPFEASLYRVRR